MATKRFNEFKNLSADEISTKIRETESELFQAKMKRATVQLEDVSTIWRLRKDLARLKTLQTQKSSKQASAT